MKYVQIERKDHLGIITLSRPEKRNALNAAFVQELIDVFDEFEKDNQIRVILLRADGDVFSAGADLKYLQELQSNTYDENLADSRHLKNLYLKIYELNKVVIAEVKGHAIAGGCGLISVCDFVFSVDEAKFGYTEVKIGFVPAIVMVFLLRKLSETHAKELLLSGYLVTAQKAVEMGLINRIIEKKDISEFTESFACDLIRNNSSNSLQVTKELIGKVQSMSMKDALDLATRSNAEVRSSDDCKRGIAAFLNGEQIFW